MLLLLRTMIEPRVLGVAILQIVVVLYGIAPLLKWGSVAVSVNQEERLVTLKLPGGALLVTPPIWEVLTFLSLIGSPYMGATVVALQLVMVRNILWIPMMLVVSLLRLFRWEVDLGCIDTRVTGLFNGVSECMLHTMGCGAFTTLTIWGLFPMLPIGAFIYHFYGQSILTDLMLRYLGFVPLFFVTAKLLHREGWMKITDLFMFVTEWPGWQVFSRLLGMKPEVQEVHH